MTATSGLREGDQIVDVQGFVDEVAGVTPYFIALFGVPWDGEGDPPSNVGPSTLELGSLHFDVQFRAYRGSFEHRFIASIFYEGYQLVADVGVRAEVPEHIRPTRKALDEFGARVALFAAYPYIREALSSLASRFELEPISFPLLRQANTFEIDESNDEIVPLVEDDEADEA